MTAQPTRQHQSVRTVGLVPSDSRLRQDIRDRAQARTAELSRDVPPTLDQLGDLAADVAGELNVPAQHLGFVTVCLSNAWWRHRFASVPFNRRLLLLPNCLRNRTACKAHFDADGLECAACGQCAIGPTVTRARQLGYRIHVAEGTPGVLSRLLEQSCDAVLGVACLDSLQKAFRRVSALGVPHLAVPLLHDGCADTKTDLDVLNETIESTCDAPPADKHSTMPLLRKVRGLFEQPIFARLMSPAVGSDNGLPLDDPAPQVALDWLVNGGKRLRPFITLAAYLAARHGSVTEVDLQAHDIPDAVCRLAVAIEMLHKASLVHDDIEDDDPFRYGRPTLHRQHGTGPAINVGDYLLGMGYRLIATQAADLGHEATTDILAHLSQAHLDLCRGQGMELAVTGRGASELRPIDVLSIYALKTAPAFETALYAGLRAGGASPAGDVLRRYCTWVGEAYQVLNDLDDWSADDNKLELGRDVLAGRPTVLLALAGQAGAGRQIEALLDRQADGDDAVDRLRDLYRRLGVFDKARSLVDKLRARALDAAAEVNEAALKELFVFLVRVLAP